MRYVIKYFDESFVYFNSMSELYEYMLNKRLSIESCVSLNEYKEVVFYVYDEYGLDIGLFTFFYEAK